MVKSSEKDERCEDRGNKISRGEKKEKKRDEKDKCMVKRSEEDGCCEEDRRERWMKSQGEERREWGEKGGRR